MKRKGIFALLIALPLLLTSCDDFGHVHNWSPYMDNGDGTHYRMCYKDSRHIETSEHNYVEEVLVEATDTTPGKILKKCKDCGHEEEVRVNPTGQHIYDQEVVSEKYLAEKTSDYSSIYYKSSTDGAYGDDSKLFEKTLLPEGYSNIEYLQGSRTEFIDTGIERTENTTVSYNDCKRGNGRLPYDYQEVEYIEFTGTQWIDTGINGDATWDFSLQWTQTQERQLMGYGGSGGEYFGVNNGYYAIYQVSETPIGNKDEVKFMYEGMNGALYVNGTRAVNGGYEAGASNKTFAVGSLHGKAFCQFKLYSLVVTKAGNKVAEFVPCYNIDTTEIGLYDLVTCVFFGNSGTGNFLRGSDVNPGSRLPADYQEVEYLEATGTQYIDTQEFFGNGFGCSITYEYTEFVDDSDVLGTDGNLETNQKYAILLNLDSQGQRTVLSKGDNHVIEHSPIEVGQIYTSDISFNNGHFSHVYGSQSIQIDCDNFDCSNPLYLFARYKPGQSDAAAKSKSRIYSCKFFKNNILVKDLIPCFRNNDFKPGFFDLIGNEFLTNSGSGEFEVGPDVRKSTDLPSNFTRLDYIESSGTQFIDTEFKPNNLTTIIVDAEIKTPYSIFGAMNPHFNVTSSKSTGTLQDYAYWSASMGGREDVKGRTIYEIRKNQYFKNGELKATFEDESWQSSLNCYLFGRNAGVLDDAGDVVIYSCEIRDDDKIVLDFVPVLNQNDGTAGLFDFVSGKFFENKGTGLFDYDYKTKRSVEIKENVKVGYRYIGEEPSYFFGRIYDATIINGNTVVQKLIPALRNSDSAIGMYDLISGKFYPQNGDFKNSGVVGHHLDKGVVTKQPTLDEEGEMTYTCSICGAQIHKKISRLAYKVNFGYDEGIKEIRIHYDDNPSHYEVSNFAYTRNPFSFNYSSTNASVWFEVICKDGYELDKVEVPFLSCVHTSKEGIEYLLLIQSDLEVNITSKQIVNE